MKIENIKQVQDLIKSLETLESQIDSISTGSSMLFCNNSKPNVQVYYVNKTELSVLCEELSNTVVDFLQKEADKIKEQLKDL